MTPTETVVFVQSVARHYPGKVTITRQELDRWTTDLDGITVEQAEQAWAQHRAVCPQPVTVADLRRHLQAAQPPLPRPDIAPPHIVLPLARMAPDVAHAELAKMRAAMRAAIGPTTPYSGRR